MNFYTRVTDQQARDPLPVRLSRSRAKGRRDDRPARARQGKSKVLRDADQPDLATDPGRLCQPTITGDKRAGQKFRRGDMGGVVRGEVAAKLPHPINQPSDVDLVDDQRWQSRYRFLSPRRPKLAAQRLTSDHRYHLDEQVGRCGPVRVSCQSVARCLTYRSIVNMSVGERRGWILRWVRATVPVEGEPPHRGEVSRGAVAGCCGCDRSSDPCRWDADVTKGG